MRNVYSCHGKGGGFTLLELLVVIAIIALLAALLFPVFARAKQQAKTTTTISNLAQLGKAMFLYTADHDDVWPMMSEGWPGLGVTGGWMVYDEYLGDDSGKFRPEQGSLYPYVRNDRVYASEMDVSFGRSGNSFAMNGCLAAFPPTPGLMASQPTTQCPSPAQMFLLSEERTSEGGTNDGFFHPLVDTLAAWHNSRTAFVFADGHAAVKRPSEGHDEKVHGGPDPCWPYEPLIR
jgi:prepilin-type N-terminal cleavage/methylation domain-containing protein/prepilin-type processing-associated H-X9-DG protein